MALRCLLVDDEFNNRDLLRILIERHCRELDVVAMAASVQQAYECIIENPPQVVFLDVEMPGGDGFELLRRFPQPEFCVVFVTAHEHYALKALKTRAFDYLLKPVRTEDLKSVAAGLERDFRQRGDFADRQQYYERVDRLVKDISSFQTPQKHKIYLPMNGGFRILEGAQVEYLEAHGNYTRIRLVDGADVLVTRAIGDLEAELPEHLFFRCHKSYILNMDFLEGFTQSDGGFCRTRSGAMIPVSRRKLADFMERIQALTGRQTERPT